MAEYELLVRIAAVLLVFGAVVCFVLWAGRQYAYSLSEGRQLVNELHLNPSIKLVAAPLVGNAANFGVIFLPLARRWEQTNRFGTAGMLEKWELLLIKGGIRSQLAPIQFMSASLLAAALAGCLMVLLAYELNFGLLWSLIAGFPAGALAGFYLLSVILTNLVTTRVAMIEKRLPFAAEFMLLAMEANAAFPTAMEVYNREMPSDPLAEEFGMALMDISTGLSAREALSNLQLRVGSESLTAFILAVTTAMETGQPIKDVLEIQADATRQRRYQSAEEIAKTAATRAVFPLFIIFIALMILLLGPMAVKVSRGSLF
jgi:pilus assembly protein TadC